MAARHRFSTWGARNDLLVAELDYEQRHWRVARSWQYKASRRGGESLFYGAATCFLIQPLDSTRCRPNTCVRVRIAMREAGCFLRPPTATVIRCSDDSRG